MRTARWFSQKVGKRQEEHWKISRHTSKGSCSLKLMLKKQWSGAQEKQSFPDIASIFGKVKGD
jgi:hypothetical protein